MSTPRTATSPSPAAFASFEDWMEAVDRALDTEIALTSDDLEDQTYRQFYDDGLTLRETVTQVIENLGLSGVIRI